MGCVGCGCEGGCEGCEDCGEGQHFQRIIDRGVSDPVIPALHLDARQSHTAVIGKLWAPVDPIPARRTNCSFWGFISSKRKGRGCIDVWVGTHASQRMNDGSTFRYACIAVNPHELAINAASRDAYRSGWCLVSAMPFHAMPFHAVPCQISTVCLFACPSD